MQFTLLNDRSQAGGSLNDGQLEMMVHTTIFVVFFFPWEKCYTNYIYAMKHTFFAIEILLSIRSVLCLTVCQCMDILVFYYMIYMLSM